MKLAHMRRGLKMREITILEGMLLDEYYRSERNLEVNIREAYLKTY